MESNPISSPPPKKKGNIMVIFHFYFTPYTFNVGVLTDLNFFEISNVTH